VNFDKITEFLKQGKGIDVEFKSAQNGVPENLFETICGVNVGIIKGTIEGAIEGAPKGVKGKLADLLSVIFTNEGKRVPDYKEITGLPESTLEGYIKRLRDADLVEFKGESAQTGGYFLTKKMKAKLK
jgi:ATP-dependent DNA helicase RecG